MTLLQTWYTHPRPPASWQPPQPLQSRFKRTRIIASGYPSSEFPETNHAASTTQFFWRKMWSTGLIINSHANLGGNVVRIPDAFILFWSFRPRRCDVQIWDVYDRARSLHKVAKFQWSRLCLRTVDVFKPASIEHSKRWEVKIDHVQIFLIILIYDRFVYYRMRGRQRGTHARDDVANSI